MTPQFSSRSHIAGAVFRFLKKDMVLTASMGLAAFSCFLNPPGKEYASYIDFHTLILLFCLMLIIEGLRSRQVFHYIGNLLLSRVSSRRGLTLALVFLCFFGSMLITNDVALITFVPFGIMLLELCRMTDRLCQTITLMTIAANLGSMFTPIGNPQNLYLYSLSGMSLKSFFLLTFPCTAAAGVLLILFLLPGNSKETISIRMEDASISDPRRTLIFLSLFLLCLLTVAGILPHKALLAVVSLVILVSDRKLFTRVDYSLLITFTFFFIFVGNIRRMDSLYRLLTQALHGHEILVSIAASQVISNVPAAMLLSGCTENIRGLIIGTNIGGLGTLIASMASLISYRQLAGKYPQLKGRYLRIFTCYNLIFLAALILLALA